eukprot:sb/3476434/
MSKVMFLTETYEALSFCFFLRLIMTYLGGKKETSSLLTDKRVKLNSPPLCCLVILDESHSYPAYLIEQSYSRNFHFFIFFSLLLAVYGLGGTAWAKKNVGYAEPHISQIVTSITLIF